MKKYDPHTAPVPEEWNLIDEAERIELIKRYHKKARVKLPNATLHTGIHTVVENQIAMGDETPVARTVERLLDEGLDRHDALHAVGAALAHHIHALMTNPETAPIENTYYKELEALTAEKWRESQPLLCNPD